VSKIEIIHVKIEKKKISFIVKQAKNKNKTTLVKKCLSDKKKNK
jgi:hypothetical protein